MLFLDQDQHYSLNSRHTASFHRDETQRFLGASHIHAAIVETLLGLLYGLSNQSLTDTGRETLIAIMEAPAWDMVFPHLRDALTETDSNMIQSIAEGLLKESVRTRHHRMLDLALGLGADPRHRIRLFDRHDGRYGLFTPLVALCREDSYFRKPGESRLRLEKMIRSLLGADSYIQDSTLYWVIRAGFHAAAEDVIRRQPRRAIDSAIAKENLEGGSSPGLDTYDPVTLLLVACLDRRWSREKRSLICYLLERNAKADLKVMIAAATTCDAEVIYLLHQHGAPVNGCISGLGSPLSSACKTVFLIPTEGFTCFPVYPVC